MAREASLRQLTKVVLHLGNQAAPYLYPIAGELHSPLTCTPHHEKNTCLYNKVHSLLVRMLSSLMPGDVYRYLWVICSTGQFELTIA